MPETPSVVELCERLAQRDELTESLSAELGTARVRIAELAARLGQITRNCCRSCGNDLSGTLEVGRAHRQAFDIPPISARGSERQLIMRRCCWGATTCARTPQGVTAPVQHAPWITAIILYLYVGQSLSAKRTAAALADLLSTRSQKARSQR